MSSSDSSITQLRPKDMFDLFSCNFQPRYEAQFAWSRAVSSVLALPGLRGCWPMSGVDNSGIATDMSGLGHHMLPIQTVDFGYDRLAPYADFDGANQYLYVLDHADFDITGFEGFMVAAAQGLTLGGWFKFDDAVPVAHETLIAKYAANQSSYRLRRTAATARPSFIVSANGVAEVTLAATDAVGANAWTFIAGRYDGNAQEMDLWINGIVYNLAAGVPGAPGLHIGTASVTIGATAVPSTYLDGKASLCWICGALLSNSMIFQAYHQQRALFNT